MTVSEKSLRYPELTSKDLYALLADFNRRLNLAETQQANAVLAVEVPHVKADARRITSPRAKDLESALVLLNEAKADYTAHIGDADVHAAADATNTIAAANATNLASAITLANEIKADVNAHRANDTAHTVADSGNAIAATNASDLPTLLVLANEIKLDLNGHLDEALAQTTNTAANVQLG